MSKRRSALVAEEQLGERLCELGLSHSGGAEKEQHGPRFSTAREPRGGRADRVGDDRERSLLTDHAPPQVRLCVGEPILLNFSHRRDRNARPLLHHPRDVFAPQRGGLRRVVAARRERHEPARRARLIDQVPRLVGQTPVRQIPHRQLDGRVDRLVADHDVVVILEPLARGREHRARLLGRRLFDAHGLKSPRERWVLLDPLAVLLGRRRADAAEVASRQRGLEQVGRVHAASGRAGADHRVQLVDEQHHVGVRARCAEQRVHALLEIAAVLRAGQHRGERQLDHAQRAHLFGRVLARALLGEPFDDRGLSDAGVADEHRVGLALSQQDARYELDLVVSPDDVIELRRARERAEVTAVFFERTLRDRRRRPRPRAQQLAERARALGHRSFRVALFGRRAHRARALAQRLDAVDQHRGAHARLAQDQLDDPVADADERRGDRFDGQRLAGALGSRARVLERRARSHARADRGFCGGCDARARDAQRPRSTPRAHGVDAERRHRAHERRRLELARGDEQMRDLDARCPGASRLSNRDVHERVQ
jgi:hypothetical protein